MRKGLKIISALLCLIFVFSTITTVNAFDSIIADTEVVLKDKKVYANATIDQDFVDNRVLVVLDKNIGGINKIHDKSLFGSVDIKNVTDLTFMSNYQEQGEFEVQGADQARDESNEIVPLVAQDAFRQIISLELPTNSKENVLETIKKLEQTDGIVYAGPDYITSIASTTSNDTYVDEMWGLEKIQVNEAWDITTGSSSVYVGVIDTGIANHPDLSANLVQGWDFVNDNSTTTDDPTGHGTHVAGTIATVGNNNVGVVGVAWNVKLVPLQVCKYSNGTGDTSDSVEAITYASNNNIPILNYSRGIDVYDYAFEQAVKNYQGLFVCSAGNDYIDLEETKYYAASYKTANMISVANTTPSDTLRKYYNDDGELKGSNYGATTVHLAAPGTEILSCYPTSKCSDGTHTAKTHYANGYHYNTGTSMAAPHVAGVAALIKSYNPNLSALDIKRLILENVDEVSSLNGKCITGGRLNAYKALSAATRLEEKPIERFVGKTTNGFSEDIVEVRKVGEQYEICTYLAFSDGSLMNLTPNSTDNDTPKKYYHTVTDFEYDTAYEITVLSGDVNGDTYMDIVFAYAGVGRSGKRNITVYFGRMDSAGFSSDESNGRFNYSITVQTPNSADTVEYPSKFFVSDADGDYADELIVMYRNPGGMRSILVYESIQGMLSANPISTETSHIYVESDPVFIGDVNGDDMADFIIHWMYNNQRRLTVLTSLGTSYATQGNTLVTTNSTLASYCSQFTVCDVNGDYNDDFVVVYKGSGSCFAQLAYLGGGSGTSASLSSAVKTTTTVPFYDIISISSGDINCNQCEDVVVEYANADVKRCLTVFYGNFGGSFTNNGTYVSVNSASTSTFVTDTVYGDFLGDGGMDVIAIWANKTATSKVMNYITYASRGSSISATSLVPYYSKKSGSINVPYYAYE